MAEQTLKKINLRADNDKQLKIDPSTIPNLVPEKILTQWMEGDNDPYYKIQKIDFPLKANSYTYTGDFFKSFIAKINRAPIPGSKGGHELGWGKRGTTDLLLIGGMVEEKKNGKGSAYFKNYIPPVGESGDNAVFIKENKSNMIDYSLVAATRDERVENADGTVDYNVLESLWGERNDAVGYGEGAMQQKTNISADEDNNDRGEIMTKKEILEALVTLKVNMDITLPEIAKAMSLDSLLVTDEQKEAVIKLNAIQKLVGDKEPAEYIKSLQEDLKKNSDDVRAASVNEAFGPKIFEDTKKENKARTYADQILGTDELTEEKVNEIKANEIYKTLAAERADVNADVNQIGRSEIKDGEVPKDGPKVRKI